MGAGYLMDAIGVAAGGPVWPDPAAVHECVVAFNDVRECWSGSVCRRPGSSGRWLRHGWARPWTMIYTWDLAVAIGGDRALDAEVVEAVVAMFLPRRPRSAVGPDWWAPR